MDPPLTVIEATRGLAGMQLHAVWQYRELLLFLAWRDIKVRYRQTALGVAWIVLQPLLSTVVLTVIFGYLLGVPSNGAPYSLFALIALVPWQYFSSSLSRIGVGLVSSAHLISKVYFPRLVIPLSSVLSNLVDFAVGFAVVIVLVMVYRLPVTPRMLWVPLFLLLAMATALGFGLWLAALNVRYRDVNYLIPFLLQIWMYATPVVFGATLIPESYRWIMALNPMTGVVEGFRWAMLGGVLQDANPPGPLTAVSCVISLVVLATGLVYFRSTERTFADVI